MPSITALLHTSNDGLRLGRALETLLPCAEVLIVDHHSTDDTLRIAREYGAHTCPVESFLRRYGLELASCDWILCLDPAETLTEGLQATLFEWSVLPAQGVSHEPAFAVLVRRQTGIGEDWLERPAREIRLVPRSWNLWHGPLPANHPDASLLEGEILRFVYP
jgi:glycosyltransferase involved in cell wall biosynthesis